MNRYGRQAMAHWTRWLPQRVAQMPDPDTFFSTLGLQVAEQVDQLADQLAGPDPPGESFQQRVGRRQEARMTAESEVLRRAVLRDPVCPPERLDELARLMDHAARGLSAEHTAAAVSAEYHALAAVDALCAAGAQRDWVLDDSATDREPTSRPPASYSTSYRLPRPSSPRCLRPPHTSGKPAAPWRVDEHPRRTVRRDPGTGLAAMPRTPAARRPSDGRGG